LTLVEAIRITGLASPLCHHVLRILVLRTRVLPDLLRQDLQDVKGLLDLMDPRDLRDQEVLQELKVNQVLRDRWV
jgi:hypothetical protein